MRRKEIEELFHLDLHEIGRLADSINRENGNYATFVINRHINYTDICVSKCPLCAFSNRENYLLSTREILKLVKDAVERGATEVHIVGGHNPEIGIEYFEDVFKSIKDMFDVTIKALTATEVDFYSRKEKMSVKEFLSRLKLAGMDAMPGGGAEILVDDVRKIIAPNKINSERWLEVMRIAHETGIKSNATMLFGHVESYKDRSEHLYKLRKLQEKTNGFISFIPLLFHPENTDLKKKGLVTNKSSPEDVLKTIAVSRIALDNFRTIRAYWVMLGERLAEVALNYGANDLDGTLMEERITHSAGAETPTSLEVERIVKIARNAGKIPAQRDTFCNIIRVF
ncbi:de-hypoxanthine futalosine cyclase [Archaeoglobus sulfaticallidus PM70-1]|uniref:De-hypoxanthine futalosine cyclase n=1 Tax=Archaeoglobus sulfaticallidus PM70-1 TaxID=387631 RepID=N0BJ42_9EURY|nr:CofH family radical SAM protein [Archaeoglobus sulfaticallidus]AGK60185.1 de-hypoxanthine futalosine cyclase [Archaeoglobus sulfaticallidus PM70-1]